MNNSSEQSRSVKVLALFLANGINLAIGILTMPYLARSLSYEEYGSYGQVLLIGTVFTVIFGLGSRQVVNVLYAENAGSEERVFSTNFWLFAASALVAALALAGMSIPLSRLMSNPNLVELILAYVPAVAFGIVGTVYTSTIVYFGKVRQLAIATVVTNIIRISLLVVAISLLNSIRLAIVALGIGAFIQAIWYLRIIPRAVRRFSFFDTGLAKSQLTLSYPLLIVSLFGAGVINADGFFVSGLLGVTEFAIYRAGALEIPLIATLYGTVAAVLMPDLARLAARGNGDELFALNRRASSVTAIAVVPVTILFVAFGEEFITLYLSEKYAASGVIFSIYSVATLFRITMYQGVPLAYKKSKYILIAFAFGLGLNVLLNLLLIPLVGAKGAAISYVVSQAFLAGYLMLLATRLTGLSLREYFDWGFLTMIGGLCVAVAAFIRYVHELYPGYLLLGLLACAYFITIFLFVWWARPEHLDILLRLVRKRPATG